MSSRSATPSRKRRSSTSTTRPTTAIQPHINVKVQRLFIDKRTQQLCEHTKPNHRTSYLPAFSIHALKQLAADVFLPIGYPASVTDDYVQYQIYDTLQGLCSYLRGLLCTQSVLIGIGVGDSTATVSNATINWLLRDGAGMIGSLLFGYMNSETFGINIKQYRILADITNNIGLALDLASALVPRDMFVYVICAATLARSLCGVAAGSTRAALVQHFARAGNNHTDLATKEGMQETFVSVLGLACGLLIAKVIDGPDQVLWSWLIFIVLTVIHVVANVRAMRGVVFDTFNKQRALLVINGYMQNNTVLTPHEVAERESVFALYRDKYVLGCAVERSKLNNEQCNDMAQAQLYYCHTITSNHTNVYLHDASSAVDQLRALFDAVYMSGHKGKLAPAREVAHFVSKAAKAGWQLDDRSVQLNADAYRYSFDNKRS